MLSRSDRYWYEDTVEGSNSTRSPVLGPVERGWGVRILVRVLRTSLRGDGGPFANIRVQYSYEFVRVLDCYEILAKPV